jgi:REP element-mobilizing transposase RayT
MRREERLNIDLNHQSPDWVRDAVYFVTVCAKERRTNHLCGELSRPILDSIRHYHEKQRWYCDLALLMPNHVHLLLSFDARVEIAKVIGDWKRWISTHHGIIWQENFFEHRVRDDKNLQEKADYILHNPVRAGLISDEKEWPYFWMPKS